MAALKPFSKSPLSSPFPELRATARIDTIPDAYNHVKIVEINLMGLSFAFDSAMFSGSCIFCNNLIWVKFSYLNTFLICLEIVDLLR